MGCCKTKLFCVSPFCVKSRIFSTDISVEGKRKSKKLFLVSRFSNIFSSFIRVRSIFLLQIPPTIWATECFPHFCVFLLIGEIEALPKNVVCVQNTINFSFDCYRLLHQFFSENVLDSKCNNNRVFSKTLIVLTETWLVLGRKGRKLSANSRIHPSCYRFPSASLFIPPFNPLCSSLSGFRLHQVRETFAFRTTFSWFSRSLF